MRRVVALSPALVLILVGGQVQHHQAAAERLASHSVRSSASDTAGRLLGVAAASATDVWAVGAVGSHTLVEHWDGVEWTAVPSPSPGTDNTLDDVSALSATDAWAVGNYGDRRVARALILHWDGTAWTQVEPQFSEPTSSSALHDVVAVSASDAWAVGSYHVPGRSATFALVEHWDGHTWNQVSDGNPRPRHNWLFGVDALSSDAAWAVGNHGAFGPTFPRIERWDGAGWSLETTPKLRAPGVGLEAVAAVSPDLVWAAGEAGPSTLIERWDGSRWARVPSPCPRKISCTLSGVDTSSATDGWAVGSFYTKAQFNGIILHWDGSTWTRVEHPNPGHRHDTELLDVTTMGSGDAWAVGDYFTHDDQLTPLILHWDGSTWSQVAA